MQAYFGLFSKRTLVAGSRAPRVSRSDVLGLVAALVLLAVFVRISPGSETSLLKIGVPAAFAIFAFLLRGVNLSGALAGAVVAFIFYGIGGGRLFMVLLTVFAITLIATQAGSRQKQKLAERTGGRSASQVMANLFVPTFLLMADRLFVPAVAFGAAFAALAELTSDTVSSEVGEAFGRPTYLVTTWKRTESGTDGGLSLLGTLSGVASALVIAAVAFWFRLAGPWVWLCAVAGILGMLVDSLLGATLERRGWLNNDAVNLLSTAAAALLGAGAVQIAAM
jgi:uncharacterized protein (TIGR00297 family)